MEPDAVSSLFLDPPALSGQMLLAKHRLFQTLSGRSAVVVRYHRGLVELKPTASGWEERWQSGPSGY
ncbi:MAG: hypothetical protein M3Q03_09475 [Chloroflexota bacterium]|nr:hypothetical protein [Chloroflexota bacterium]